MSNDGVNDGWGAPSSSSSNWGDWDNQDESASNEAGGSVNDGPIDPNNMVVELVGNSEYCKQRFVLKPGPNTIGRQRDCDCVVDFGGVSRHHATIEVGADGTITIMDNQSGNGTSLGGVRLEALKKYPIKNGDTILISKPSFILQISSGSAARPMEPEDTPRPMHPASAAAAKRLNAPTMVGSALQPVLDADDDENVGMDIEFEDEMPPAPPAAASGNNSEMAAKIAKLEAERQQLARLFEMAIRYLTRDAGETTSSILFKVLGDLVEFDCAFVAAPTPEGKMRFSVHPTGAALVKQNKSSVAQFAREGDGKHTVVFDGPSDAVAMAGLAAKSRAIIPFGKGGRLVIISQKPNAYAGQVEYLDLIGRLHTCIE